MSQIVKPESGGELCANENWLKVSAYKIPKNYRRTLTRSKNQIIVLVIRAFLQRVRSKRLVRSAVRDISTIQSRLQEEISPVIHH